MTKYFTRKTYFLLALLLFSGISSFAQNIDYQFNPFIVSAPGISEIIIQEGGKIILGGDIASIGSKKASAPVRLNPDGTLDTSFNTNIADGDSYVYKLKMTHDGKILLIKADPYSAPSLLRLNPDGSEDKTFDIPDELNINNYYAIQDDKYIVLSFIWNNNTSQKEIIRLNDDGSIDLSFTPFSYDGEITTLEVLPDHKIFVIMQTEKGSTLLRLHQDGTLDDSFDVGTGFDGKYPGIKSLAVQPNGQILISGYFTSFNGIENGGFIRLNTDGSVDPTFVIPGPTVNTFNNGIIDIQLLPSGKMLVSGSNYDYNTGTYYLVMRLNHDGSLDLSFPLKRLNQANGTYSFGCNIAMYGEIIYLAGAFSTYDTHEKYGLIAIDSDGNLQESFNPKIRGEIRINHSIQQPDKKVIIAGNFIEINGNPTKGLARLNADGTLDTTFTNYVSKGLDKEISSLALQSDGRILIGGLFDKLYEQDVTKILRLNSDGSLDTTFKTNFNLSYNITRMNDIQVWDDDKILVQGVSYKQQYFIQLFADGTLNDTFAPKLEENLYALSSIFYKDKIIMGGHKNHEVEVAEGYWTSITKGYIKRFNADGSIDSSFQEMTFNEHNINTIGIINDRIIAGGSICVGHGDADKNPLFQIDQQGQIVDPYSLGFNGFGTINAILPVSDSSMIIGGAFSKINRFERHGLAKADLKGRVYSDFRYDVDGYINGIIQENENQMLVFGSFDKINGVGGFSGIARLNINTPRSPVELSAIADATKGIVLTWKDSSDMETGYKIYRSSANSSGYEVIDSVGANVTTYVDTSVNLANTYQYQVISLRDTLQSDFSNQVSISTTDFAKPETPQDLMLESEKSIVHLSWNFSGDVSGYIIERSSGSGFMVMDTVETNTYIDSQVTLEITYHYRVKAYNFLGESGYSPVVDFTNAVTAVAPEPAAKEVVAYPNPSAGTITILLKKRVSLDQMAVFNMENKKMHAVRFSYKESNLKVDLSALGTGVYLLKINTGSGIATYRLIKE